MKKGFTLIELIVSIAITAIILSMVYSITDFTFSLLTKQEHQEEYLDEIILVDELIKKFIDESKSVDVNDNKLIRNETDRLFFRTASNDIYINDKQIVITTMIKDITFSKNKNLITAEIWINDTEYITFQYFK